MAKPVNAAGKGKSKTPPDLAAPPPKPRRAYLPAEERRRSIILAAQQVFSRSNLQGARTRDIAKAAEINQATLFEHFDSKAALFEEAVMKPMLEAMRGMYDRARNYEQAGSPEEIVPIATESARRHLETMIEIFPLLTAALFSDPDIGGKLYREQIAPLLKVRGEVIRELTDDAFDPELVALANFGVFFAIAMHQHFTGETSDVEAIARQTTRTAIFGFLKDRYKVKRETDG